MHTLDFTTLPEPKAYLIKDYTTVYEPIMQFNKNKTVSVHQWYPFVEGYSKEFIESILAEINYRPQRVLEPFSGSGTTPLELQLKNINCVSFEVSPFMHLLSSVKLVKNYNVTDFLAFFNFVKEALLDSPKNIRNHVEVPFGRTVVKNDKLKKWNFNDDSLDGILDIKYSISKVHNHIYKNLFNIVLASILLEVSNLFRNGKALSYKKNWETRVFLNRTEVHGIFLSKLENIILGDIELLQQDLLSIQVDNLNELQLGDVRTNIAKVPDKTIDLIITSPPYLNSRDYTDIYMLELKVLDLITNYEELSNLRRETLRSHVQVKYEELEVLNIPTLKIYIDKISKKGINFWNSDLLNMIKGYFLDMDHLFKHFHRVMQPDKFIYFNVANSAYFGEEIKVDEIICDIAINQGFRLIEIRKARSLRSSSQQSGVISNLRESVIVFKS